MSALTTLTDQLAALDRDDACVGELAKHVCAVLWSKPADQGATASGTESSDPANSSTSSQTLDERTMRRLEREKEQAARDANTAQEKAVTETLGRVLLGKAKLSKNTANAAASQQQLDVAFMQYTTLLSQTSALQRDWSTGQSVLAELNKLHGRDEQMIFTGIQTRCLSTRW